PTSIATAVLTITAMMAGCEKGWPEQKTRVRAIAFADDPKHQAAYIQLMRQSAWNAHFGEHPPVGAQLWLPPLRQSAIFDRGRRWRVALSTQRWPDGSERLEPPAEGPVGLRTLGPHEARTDTIHTSASGRRGSTLSSMTATLLA
ncbi:MAG: hypothetical protein KC457_31285, partial [Myxococcales bacterium]|nr:hypothetical protein [Myxococcales bacterium]